MTSATPFRFSANLGFLWRDLPLLERIGKAADAGFEAVECHFPYDTDPGAVSDLLQRRKLPMLALNTFAGDRFGFAARPGFEKESRAAIDEAIGYAAAIGAGAVHVMAGQVDEEDRARADRTYRDALRRACDAAGAHDLTVLIEPLNPRSAPGYWLDHPDKAADLIGTLEAPNLKIMFDVFHIQIICGDILKRFEALRDLVGHLQIAAVPSREEPDVGEIDYRWLLPAIAEAGYDGWIGAEYVPRGTVEEGLGWRERLLGG